MVLTHTHKDHVGGLDWLVTTATFPIRQVWFSDEQQVSGNDYDAFIDGVAARNIPITRPTESPHTFPGFPNFELRVFNNGREFAGSAAAGGNNDSVVFQVRYRPSSTVLVTALFTGDIEGEQGQRLVTQFGSDLRSDIVKVPHHGSEELFPGFPTAVAARFAFVSSSGTHGSHKHPRKSALDRYDTTAQVFCTCDSAKKKLNSTVNVSNAGNIAVSPLQPPYFAWVRISSVLRRRTITPTT